MSRKIFSEEDIEVIHSIVPESFSDGNSCVIELFDSTALLSSIPAEKRFVLEQFSQDNTVVQFTAWFVFLLIKSVNDIRTDSSKIACDTSIRLFSSFFRRLKDETRFSLEDISFNITNWVEFYEDVVNYIEYFYHDDLINSTTGSGISFTVRYLYYKIESEEEKAFDALAEVYYGKKFLDEMLYNFWGDDFSLKRKKIDYRLPLTTEEKAAINKRDNRHRMFDECRQLFMEDNSDIGIRRTSLFFEKLFKDYISRIRDNIQDVSVLPFATYYWKTITFIIMGRVLYESRDFEDEGGPRFNYEDYDHCHHAISDICERYLEQLKSGSPYCEWCSSIKDLDIHYDELYNKMTMGNNKFFIASCLTLADFTRGFEEANMKPLYVAVDDFCRNNSKGKSGKLGCIRYMISELGNYLGEEWLLKAAESVCSKKGREAKNLMRNHTDTRAIKDFSDVIHGAIPHLPYREKKQRQKD